MVLTAPAPRVGVGGLSVTAQMRANVAEVLDSAWFSPGRFCARFEREWAALHEREYAVFMNSGTSALQVGLAAMKEKYGWPDGAKVVVPALTFVASVNTILQNGLVPVFRDIDEWYGLDVRDWTPPKGTVAVMPVHINGQQCDMPTIWTWAGEHGLRVIEDSCETVDASLQGIKSGAWGDVAAYSTYACHHVTTGVGGLALTDDAELAGLIRSLANHGRDGIFFDKGADRRELLDKRFFFERQGYSYRASEFEAAIGCAMLPDLGRTLRERRANADLLSAFLVGLPVVLPEARPAAQWWPMFYPLLTERRDALEMHLDEFGIDTRRVLPLTNQPVYRDLVRESDHPNAARVNREGLYVGIQPGADIVRTANAIREFFA
jgi:dTDP-4-amino-4,6-dideoxygalactose transaminase